MPARPISLPVHPRRVFSAAFLYLLCSAMFAGHLGMVGLVWAQESKAEKSEEKSNDDPLGLGLETNYTVPPIVASLTSLDGLKADAQAVFDEIGRSEMMFFVESQMAKYMNDLKGIDRTRPLGLFIYLGPGLISRPTFVGFVPVTDQDEFFKTLTARRGNVQPSEAGENHFEMKQGRRTNHILLQNGYAFITRQEEMLEGELPDPVALTKSISSRYDAGVSFHVDRIPKTVRDVFMQAFRFKAETELQQHDDEPEGAYKVRKESGQALLELIDQGLTQGESLTLGVTVPEKAEDLTIEVSLVAQPDSQLAKTMTAIDSRPSRFAALADRQLPLVGSLSWMLGPRGQKIAEAALTEIENRIRKQLEGKAPELAVAEEALRVLKDTAKAGHIDAVLQTDVDDDEKFVFWGGVAVSDGPALQKAITEFLKLAPQKESLDRLAIELGAFSHEGITFHRLALPESDEPLFSMINKHPAVYWGADDRVIWFALGGETAPAIIRKGLDFQREQGAVQTARETSMPFRWSISYFQFIAKMSGHGLDEDTKKFFEGAFEDRSDQITFELQPTERGMRARLRLGNGFLALWFSAIVKQIDQSQQL